MWPNVLERVKERRRFTWMVLGQNATVTDVADGVLTLTFNNPGARDSFATGGSADVLRDVLIDEVGADLRIVAVVGDAPTTQQSVTTHPARVPEPAAVDEGVSADDEVFDDGGATATELLASQLGAQIIETTED